MNLLQQCEDYQKGFEEGQKQACAGKFFNRVDIKEEVHMPDELIGYLENRGAVKNLQALDEWLEEEKQVHINMQGVYDDDGECEMAMRESAVIKSLTHVQEYIREIINNIK